MSRTKTPTPVTVPSRSRERIDVLQPDPPCPQVRHPLNLELTMTAAKGGLEVGQIGLMREAAHHVHRRAADVLLDAEAVHRGQGVVDPHEAHLPVELGESDRRLGDQLVEQVLAPAPAGDVDPGWHDPADGAVPVAQRHELEVDDDPLVVAHLELGVVPHGRPLGHLGHRPPQPALLALTPRPPVRLPEGAPEHLVGVQVGGLKGGGLLHFHQPAVRAEEADEREHALQIGPVQSLPAMLAALRRAFLRAHNFSFVSPGGSPRIPYRPRRACDAPHHTRPRGTPHGAAPTRPGRR